MKKNWCSRLFALLLCVGLMLCASAPVLAAAPIESLKVVIHNNEGMGAMTETMFNVYQLFTGTPNWEGEPKLDGNQWAVPGVESSDTQWNNWTLADVQWGASVSVANQQTLIDALTKLDSSTAAWAWPEGSNVFAQVDSAASVAAVLADHFDNAFMQAFMKWLTSHSYLTALTKEATADTVSGTSTYYVERSSADDPKDDTLTYTFGQTGYYLFAPDSTVLQDQPLSEFIVAVVGYQDIYIKTSQPSLDKVIENEAGPEGDAYAAVAGVGDTLTFKITAGLPASFADYTKYTLKLTDTLSKGLTYTDIESVTLVNKESNADVVYTIPANDSSTVTQGYSLSFEPESYTPGTLPTEDSTKLIIKFDDLRKGVAYTHQDGQDQASTQTLQSTNISPDAKFVVTYTAQVNQNAVVSADFSEPSAEAEHNFNNVEMEYSNDPNNDTSTATEPGPTDYIFVFALDLNKTGENGVGLPGAGFYLTKKEGEITYVARLKSNFMANPNDSVVNDVQIMEWINITESLPAGLTSIQGVTNFETLLTVYEDRKADYQAASNTDSAGEAEQALKDVEGVLKNFLISSREKIDSIVDAGSVPPISGLGDGTYTFTELVVPDGYNGIAPIIFTVTSQLNESKNALADVTFKFPGNDPEIQIFTGELATFHGHLTATVENEKAPLLPFTGGLGATMIYAAGFVFVVVSLVFLMLNRKKQRVA